MLMDCVSCVYTCEYGQKFGRASSAGYQQSWHLKYGYIYIYVYIHKYIYIYICYVFLNHACILDIYLDVTQYIYIDIFYMKQVLLNMSRCPIVDPIMFQIVDSNWNGGSLPQYSICEILL